MSDDFTAVSTPARQPDGRFLVDVPDGWQQGRGAYGGLVLAYLVRALEDVVGASERPLRSLTAEIFAPVLPGPGEVRVEVLRAGSGSSTAAARLVQNGEPAAHAVGVFGRARAPDVAWAPPRPTLPPWADVPVARPAPGVTPPFVQHLELRPLGPVLFTGVSDATRTSGWVRFHQPGAARDAAYLVALADVWWPALMARFAAPRPAATVAFTLQVVGSLDGLDPAAPVFHEGEMPVFADGQGVELRTLRGVDGRLLTMNQQTITLIR
jgi:hypothetical protein